MAIAGTRLSLPRRLAARVGSAREIAAAYKLEEKSDIDGAVAHYRLAVEAAAGDPHTLAVARGMLSVTLIEAKRDADAIPILRQMADDALVIKRYRIGLGGIRAPQFKLETLQSLAEAYQRLGDRKAEHDVRLEQADAARTAGNTGMIYEALLQAASAQSARGYIAESIAEYEQVLAEAESRANPRARAFVLVPLASLRFHIGDLAMAWEYAREAVELRVRTAEAGLIGESRYLLAFFHLRTGNLESARIELTLAIEALESSPDDADQLARYRRELAAFPGPFGESRWADAR